MKRVIIEHPYAAPTPDGVAANVGYGRACLLDSLGRGEAPFASALFFPQVLDDLIPEERQLGIEAGLAWGEVAELVAIYVDRGVSPGMRLGLQRHLSKGREVEFRSIHGLKPLREFWLSEALQQEEP